MTYKYLLLPALMTASSLTIAADAIEDQLDILENELRILKSQNESSQAQAIRFNGFFSVGATSASNNLGYVGSNNRYDFEELTKLGLQASFEVNDSTSVTTQILGKGTDDFDAKMEWTYVSHTFENDTTVRAGKLRLPLFIYSDFLDVGIAQPWLRPPEEGYGAPVSTYLGVDYSFNAEFDNSTLGIQLYGGQAEFTNFGQSIEVPVIGGIVTTWSFDTLTLRGTYLQVESINNSSDGGGFYGLATIYDNGQLLVVGEYTGVQSDNTTTGVNQTSGYVTLGYRINALMPYVNFAKIKSKKDNLRPPQFSFFKQQLTAYSLGAKYNLASNMAIKADATYVTDFGNTNGVIDPTATSIKYDDSIVYSVRLDTVF